MKIRCGCGCQLGHCRFWLTETARRPRQRSSAGAPGGNLALRTGRPAPPREARSGPSADLARRLDPAVPAVPAVPCLRSRSSPGPRAMAPCPLKGFFISGRRAGPGWAASLSERCRGCMGLAYGIPEARTGNPPFGSWAFVDSALSRGCSTRERRAGQAGPHRPAAAPPEWLPTSRAVPAAATSCDGYGGYS